MLARWQRTVVDPQGNIVPSAQLIVRRESDQALATVYRDRDGTNPYPSGLVTADANGYAYFYADVDFYRITSVEPVIDWRDVEIGGSAALREQLTQSTDTDEGSGMIVHMPESGPATTVRQQLLDDKAAIEDNAQAMDDLRSSLWTGILIPRAKPPGFDHVPGNIFECVTAGQAKHDIDLEWEFRTLYSDVMGDERGPDGGAWDCWVDPVNGNDANQGTLYSPVKTLKAALGKAFGTIWLVPGRYTEKFDVRNSDRTGRAFAIKSWGGIGEAVFVGAGQQPSQMTWTASGAAWEATPSGGETAQLILYVGNGREVPIQYKTSVSAVNAGAHGWYQNPTTKKITLRYENRNIEADKSKFEIIYQASQNSILWGGRTFLKGIGFRGANQFDMVFQDDVRPVMYMQDCELSYLAGANVHTEGAIFMAQRTTSRNALVNDGFNYYDSVANGATPGGIPTLAVEIDCKGLDNGVPESAGFVNFPANQTRNKQGSSGHESSIICRINGLYQGNYGQNIADTGAASDTWMVGTQLGNPRNYLTQSSTPGGYPNLHTEGTAWLDTVTAGGRLATQGLRVESGTCRTYRCGFSGTEESVSVNTGAVLQEYDARAQTIE